jgi:hypothetical protein
MTLATYHHIVDLVRTGGLLADSGRTDAEGFTELASWLRGCLERDAGEDVQLLAQLVQAEAQPAAERHLRRMMRLVAGSQGVVAEDGAEEELFLLALPLFLHPRQGDDANAVLAAIECRPELERSLEAALELPYASLRLAEFPVSAIDLEQLDMHQARQLTLDLLQQGDSPFLTPPVLDVGASPEAAQQQSWLWPLVLRVAGPERDAALAKVAGAMRQSPQLARFKQRADELLEQELASQLGMAVCADFYMPALYHQVFSLFRVLDMNVRLHQALRRFKDRCNSVSFGLFGNRLRYSLLDAQAQVLMADELRAPDEAGPVISQAVRSACARHGVACTVQLAP